MPPSRVDVFAMVIGSWPLLVFGGPRCLHQVRRHFLVQCQVLHDAGVSHWSQLMPFRITKQMSISASYGISGLQALDFALPVARGQLGLQLHPALNHLVLKDDLSSEAAAKIAVPYGRVRREMVYEWCRLNLDDIQKFLDIIMGDTYWSKYKRSYLLESQMIYRRCTACQPPDLPEVTQLLTEKSQRLWKEEEEIMRRMAEKFERAYEERKKRRDFFKYWGSDERKFSFSVKSWRGEVPRVTALTDTQEQEKRLAYLEDSEPRMFFRELKHEKKRAAPDVRGREPNERLPGEIARPAKKRAKRDSTFVQKPIPGPVWEEECELKLNNSITDSDLLGF